MNKGDKIMEITRTLRKNSSGDDVRWLKDWLFENDFYSAKIKKITHNRYGGDTVNAVKAFQRKYDLAVDGIFGPKSREKLYEVIKGVNKNFVEYVTAKEFPRISEANRKKINTALNGSEVTSIRRNVVLEALKQATDASIGSKFSYPSSLYIRGGNLYNTNGKINVITYEYLTKTYAKNYASFCTKGRLEMMQKAVKANPNITGADCSGGIIGIFRHFGLVTMKTDEKANGLCGSGYSTVIKKDELIAGDFIGKDGHICLYVGGGLRVEWVGGEWGCQLVDHATRKGYSYTKKKMTTLSNCTRYRRPKVYK
jgi:peptidoglycan hydrolase-like protein with peptidoglycan-binding domain